MLKLFKKYAVAYIVYGLFFLGCFQIAEQFFKFYSTQQGATQVILAAIVSLSLVTCIVAFQKKQSQIRQQLIQKEREKAKRVSNQRVLTKEVLKQSINKYIRPTKRAQDQRKNATDPSLQKSENLTLPTQNEQHVDPVQQGQQSSSPIIPDPGMYHRYAEGEQSLKDESTKQGKYSDSAVLFSNFHTYVIPNLHYQDDISTPQMYPAPEVKNVKFLKNGNDKFLYRPIVNFSHSKHLGSLLKLPPQFLNFN